MEVALLALFTLGMTALMLKLERSEHRQKSLLLQRWRDAAKRLGLSLVETPPLLFGLSGDLTVDVSAETDARRRCVVKGPALHDDLTLVSESLWKSVAKAYGGEDVKTGDAAFDQAVHVSGSEALALALLDAAGRRAVARVLGEGGEVTGGRVQLDRKGSVESSDELVELVERCLAVGRALSADPESVPQRLCDNLRTEPLPEVRVRLLSVLDREYPRFPGTADAARHALEDADAAVRLLAAKVARDEPARVCLEALVRDDGVDAALRARALEELVRAHPSAGVRPFIALGLASSALPLQLRAAACAGVSRDAFHLPQLKLLAEHNAEEVRIAVAKALGELGAPEGELVLMGRLADTEAVQLAAAEALAELGTLAAVEALLPLAQSLKPLGGVKEAARTAIRTIQVRHSAVGSGGLSVVDEGATGGLSVVSPPDKARDSD